MTNENEIKTETISNEINDDTPNLEDTNLNEEVAEGEVNTEVTKPLIDRTFEKLISLVTDQYSVNYDNMKELGHLIAETVKNGRNVYLSDSGHTIMNEFLHRVGGPEFYKRVGTFNSPSSMSFSNNSNQQNSINNRNVVVDKDREDEYNKLPQQVKNSRNENSQFINGTQGRFGEVFKIREDSKLPPDINQMNNIKDEFRVREQVFINDKLVRGDLVILGTVSGRRNTIIEFAKSCKDKGLTTVAITSFDYSEHVKPNHSSGKHIKDVVDHAYDNLVPYGDSTMDIGFEAKFLPASGIAVLAFLWGATAVALEELKEVHNIEAGLLKSVGLESNDMKGHNTKVENHYKEFGY